MGDFYNSICVPGDHRERVRKSLIRWLAVKGYELSDRPPLFDLDGDSERCAFLVWNHSWTLLFFSKYEEERRLIRELQSWSELLLYIWVYDSEVWGYDVFDARGIQGSFSSDPRSHLSFDDSDEARPAAVPGEVCRLFDLVGREAELERIHKRRAIFKEDVCSEMCELLGAAPAMTSYDDLESGAFEPGAGWHVQQLLFIERGSEPDPPADLHDVALSRVVEEPEPDGTAAVEIAPEVLAGIERDRRAPLTLMLLRPASWLAQSARSLYEAPARVQRPQKSPPREPQTGSVKLETSDLIEVKHLINERHGCRIRLPVGGETTFRPSKPASVFSFRIGDTSVTCTARPRARIEEVLQQPNLSKVLRDDKFQVGDLPARHVMFELPPYYLAGTSGPSYLGLQIIQTQPALYVFLYRFPRQILEEVERAISGAVRSFQLVS